MAHVARRLARRLGFLAFAISACVDLESIAPESKGNDASATEARVTIDLDRDSIAHAVRKQYSARVQTAYGEIKFVPVTWSSTNPDVVQITPAGLATAVGAGSAQLVATIPGDADTMHVSVYGFVSTFDLVPELVEILEGDTLTFAPSFGQQGGSVDLVQWRTSDTSRAVVDDNGTLVAKVEGDLEVMARYGAKEARALVRVLRARVTSIRIHPEASTLQPGQSVSLEATLRDAIGRRLMGRNVKWASSDPAVATVDAQGVVTARAKGVALVTAESETADAAAAVSVSARAVSSVTPFIKAEDLVVGEKSQATARVLDAFGSVIPPDEQPVTWHSSNPTVASVSSGGLVTAIAAGKVAIHAASGGKSGVLNLTVTATNPQSLHILPSNPTITEGSQVQLTAEGRDEGGKSVPTGPVTWTVADSKVATISADGRVQGVGAGTTNVTATSGSLSAITSLTVTSLGAASVSVSPTSLALDIGDEVHVSAVVRDNAGKVLPDRAVTWSSSNPSVAMAWPEGVVEAMKPGTAIVTATVDGKSADLQVTVDGPSPVTVMNIAVSLADSELEIGEKTQATAVVTDAQGKVMSGQSITWSSSAPSLATVSSSGVVTAVAPGTVTIVASSGGKKGVAGLSVNQAAPKPVASVTVTLTPSSVQGGQKAQATVVLKDADGNTLTGRTVSYSSLNSAVAVVSSSGTVTGVAAGQATIRARSEGRTGTAVLTVTSGVAEVASVELSASTSTLTVGQSTQVTAVTRDAQGKVLTGRDLAWKSSNQQVATVTSDGRVSAVAGGTATITATSDNGKVGSLGFTVQSGGPAAPAPVASVALSLASNSLDVGGTTQASVVLKDASGKVLTGRSIAFSSSNLGVATVTQSGVVTAVAPGSAQISAVSEGKSGNSTVTVSAPLPPPPPPQSPPPANGSVESIMGQVGTAAATKALGGVFARYESDFVKYDEAQWKHCGPAWDCIDYYDRAMIYYVWWRRTGDSKYRDRANQVAVNFRTQYLEGNSFGISHHWAMMDGVALHYVLTGDSKSLAAVGGVADNFAYLTRNSGYISDPSLMDNRIQAYAIKSLLLAQLLKAPSVGNSKYGWGGGNNWATELRATLNRILGTRDSDGQWRGAKCGSNGRATHPFTVGLLWDALIRYYEQFEADPRIPDAIRKSAEVMWSQDWISNSSAFKYVGVDCPGEGGPTPAADLNNLIVNGFAWIYKLSGDNTWRTRADQIFAGSVNKDSPSSSAKHFNQSYTSSYRYLLWR